jgi:hypothetical protein
VTPSDRAWCYYRNLVQTVYREARHIGGGQDRDARLRVADPALGAAVANIRRFREALKSTRLFDKVRDATRTDGVTKPYEEATGLRLEEVAELFGRDGWYPTYGGPRWQRIASLAIELRDALEAGEGDRAEQICDTVRAIEHNSGPLVPRTRDQHNREKWPVLCDAVEE